jgi:hypothetical protein
MPDKRMKGSWALPVDDVKRGRELAPAEGSNKSGVDLHINFEVFGDADPRLDLAKKIEQGLLAEAPEMAHLALAPGPRDCLLI